MNKKTAIRSLVAEAGDHVSQLLGEKLPEAYLFNNLNRTLEYLSLSEDFAEAMKLPVEEKAALQLALWFRSAGYTGKTDHPLEESAVMAARWLEEKGADRSLIDEVERLIRHSAPGHSPESELEKVVHDIVWSFLGEKRFFDLSNLLRLERESLEGKKLSVLQWNREMIDLLAHTNFYTSQGRDLFLDRKIKNLGKQRDRMVKAQQEAVRKKTGKDFGRGVDTIFRVAFQNHMNLSQIADGKANMIISINTAVISGGIGFGTLVFTNSSWLEEILQNWPFLFPVVILLLGSLVAVVFAVLSAIPKISSLRFTEEELEKHEVSLLYFGNFLKMPQKKFVAYLRDLKEDQSILYDDLSRDLYTLGLVLDKKYRLLIYAYRVFVGGLVLSLLSLIVTGLVVFL